MLERRSHLPPVLQRIFRNEDSLLGNLVVWYLCVTVFPAGGFYLGTIVSPASDANGIRHYWDLHVIDIHMGGVFALIGLAIGICFGVWITFWYPRLKEADAAEDEAHSRYVHDVLSHHDVLATEAGQSPESIDEH